MLNIAIFFGTFNSLPVLTETSDVDEAGYILFRQKKIEQVKEKLDKHLEERLKEDPSKNMTKKLN